MQPTPRLLSAVPATFVLLWSTGFIGAKLGLPHAEPFTFLALRFALVCTLLGCWALWSGAAWPINRRLVGHLAVSGLLVHAIYLGGVFSAIDRGINAGLSALIVGAQPLLTAALAGTLIGENVSRRQWFGLCVGFGGISLVVGGEVRFSGEQLTGFLMCIAALLGITLGTLYQKRYCSGMDPRTGTLVQYLVTALVMALLALIFEERQVAWTGEFLFALIWLSLVLSIGAVSLLWWLIRHGAAAKVASLFYLVPPVTSLVAYVVFGETFTIAGLLGFALAVAGVALVHRG